MSLAALNNPFLVQRLDNTEKLPPGDVPELHAEVLDRCRSALDQTRRTGHAIGVLVVGEAGSGKSHLIAQFRNQLAAVPNAVLAAVPLHGAFSGCLWRHLRDQVVTELLRQYPERNAGANGLLRILRNRFPQWAASQGQTGGLLEWLVGRPRSGESLQPVLEAFAQTCPLDYGLQKVLPKLANADVTNLAMIWLRGKQLGADDLQRLGLPVTFPSEQEQEKNAREFVFSFLRLAGEATALVICFDEVEAIQAGSHDAAALQQFASLATDLLAEPGPRVIATFIRPNLQLELSRAVEVSNLQKLSQDTTTIPPLTLEQAVRVTVSRLEGEPGCRAARLQHPKDNLWPIGRSFVQREFDKNKRCLTPRHLIRACAVEFDRLKKGTPQRVVESALSPPPATNDPGSEWPTEPGEKAAPPEPPPAREFMRVWEKRRKKLLEKLQGVSFDSVMALGLPWLIELTESPLVCVREPDRRLGDVNLVFQSSSRSRKPVGISFCNHSPRSLWRRLDRLLVQWKQVKETALGALVILRSETEPITDASDDRLTALKQAGARVVIVDRQQLAELAAFQGMLTDTHEGDLTRNGRPITLPEFSSWAKENMSEAVKELFYTIFELGPPPPAPPSPSGAEPSKKPTAAKR